VLKNFVLTGSRPRAKDITSSTATKGITLNTLPHCGNYYFCYHIVNTWTRFNNSLRVAFKSGLQKRPNKIHHLVSNRFAALTCKIHTTGQKKCAQNRRKFQFRTINQQSFCLRDDFLFFIMPVVFVRAADVETLDTQVSQGGASTHLRRVGKWKRSATVYRVFKNHFYCYNKKSMSHKSKITPATSSLFCNPPN